jgi:hypothetical protein
MKYLYDLKFHEKPDYEFIRRSFSKIIRENGFEVDQRYDWVEDIELNKN